MNVKRSLIATVKGTKDGGVFDPQKLSKELSKAYKKKTSGYKRKYSFSPSSVVYGNGQCARYWYLAFNGTTFDDTIDAASMAAMENGTMAHERIQDKFRATGRVVEIEREAKYADPPIRGFIDVIIDEDGEEIIGEIKTVRSDMFQSMTDAHDPKAYHMLQLLIYMYVQDKKEGFVLYENKDNHELCIMPVIMNDRTRKIVEYAMSWMKEVRAAYENDTVPDKGYAETSYQCKGCPVRKACAAETRVDIKIENLKVG